MRPRTPTRLATVRPVFVALALAAIFATPATVRGAVKLGMHMDFVLENGTTVRVFPAAEESDAFGLRPVWRNAPPAGPAFDDSSCDALEKEYEERARVRSTALVTAQATNANTPLAGAQKPAWIKLAPKLRGIYAIPALVPKAKPTAWYYLPTEPRLTFKGGKPEATFLSFVTDDETGPDAADGGLFHLMVGYGLTREEQAELAEALAAAVPGAQLKGMVELTPAGTGENFVVTSGTLRDQQFAPTGILTSGRAPTYPGGKAALAGRLSDLGAQLLFATFEKPTSDLSVTFAYDYIAKTRAFTAEISINLDRVRKLTECALATQDSQQEEETKWVFAIIPIAWTEEETKQVSRKQVEEAYEALLTSGAITIKIDQNLPDVEVVHLEQSLMEMALESFLDMQRSFALPEDDDAQQTGEDERGEELPNALNYEVYKVKRKRQNMSGRITFRVSKSMAVYRTHAMTGNLGAELKRYEDDVFSTVILNDPFFRRGTITVDLDADALDLFEARMVNNASIEVVVPFASGRDFRDNDIFTASKVAEGNVTRVFTFATAGEKPGDDDCPFSYIESWSLRGGGKWPPNPEPVCQREMSVTLTPPIEGRAIEVEADLDELEGLGIRAADVLLRHRRYGKEQIETVKFRVARPEPYREVKLFVDKGEDERTPVDYSVVFTHKEKGQLPQTPWQRLESSFVYASVSGLPKSTRDVLGEVVAEIKDLLKEESD